MSNANATASATSGGIGIFGLTFVVLLVLKLTGLASISWLIVFLPLIIAAGLSILGLIIVIIGVILVAIFGQKKKPQRRF